MGSRDIYDRMKVDIPVGELRGMKIDKFEVVYPEKWTKEHKNRKDVMSPLQLSRMLVEGSAPEPGWYTRLTEAGRIWMSDTKSERRDHADPVSEMSHTNPERVLINGLGIGMGLSAALSFECVKHVDVVEIDDRVIDLVGPHYTKDSRVHIHQANAVDQMKKWTPGDRWDVAWTDIWPDLCVGNLPEMAKFSEFYGARCGFHGNWSEDRIKRLVWDTSDRHYMKYLTKDEKEQFEEEDEGWEW